MGNGVKQIFARRWHVFYGHLIRACQIKPVRLSLVWLSIYCVGQLSLIVLCALLPLPERNDKHDFAKVVVDSRGEPLRVFADSNGVWRYQVALDDVSPLYIEALLTYEDRWFYWHRGVNPFALLRGAGQWVLNGRLISGGSTLSMQVARILEPHPRTFVGKARQMFRAIQLERTHSKQQILTLYLNYAPFGGPVEGVQAASYIYFGKPAKQLTHAEAALLAVLPQAPSRLRPDRYAQRAEQARNKVLARMQHFNVWSQQQVNEAKQEPVIARHISAPKTAPLLARRLIQQYPQQQVIHSTLDKNLQQALETIAQDYALTLPQKTSTAILVIDNHTMAVRAYVGSANFDDLTRYGHVDMITANRSPGSTLKPFLYGMAIDEGLIHEQSLLLDTPTDFAGYRPENFAQDFSGPVSTRQALQRSLNVPAVQVLDALGPQAFYARLASAGLTLKLPAEAAPNLSLILGGAAASLEDLTATFAAIGRGGVTRAPVYLQNQTPAPERTLLSAASAWVVGDILRGVALNSAHRQTVIAANTPRIAFKTGTSYGYRDAWVLAASEHYTIGVWVGRPDGTPTAQNVGRENAVPLLRKTLALFSDAQLAPPKRPAGLSREIICWPLGGLKQLQSAAECLREKSAWLLDGAAPPTLREPLMAQWSSYKLTLAVNAKGEQVLPQCMSSAQTGATQNITLAVWPRVLEPWLPQKWRRAHLLPVLAANCKLAVRDTGQQLVLEGISNNAEYYPAPGQSNITLQPSVRGASGKVEWFVNGVWVAATVGNSHSLELAKLAVGKHTLSVMDAAGRFDEIVFYVGA